MDPLSIQNANLVNAVQALLLSQGPAPESSALMALLGQDVEMLFQALAPEGVQLRLPSGQTVTAQGELPYPEGTQLRMRVLPANSSEAGLRLQLLEAWPPAPPALLAPLLQGEGQSLMTRLLQDAVPELVPLAKLLSILADPSAAPSPPPAPPLSSPERIQAAVDQLPSNALADLAKMLGSGVLAQSPEVAKALGTVLASVRAESSGPIGPALQNTVEKGITVPGGPAPTTLPSAPGMQVSDGQSERTFIQKSITQQAPIQQAPIQQVPIQQVLARFQVLASQALDVPAERRDFLVSWLRSVLSGASVPEAAPQLPSLNQWRNALRQLPEAVFTSLGKALDASVKPEIQELARALQKWALGVQQSPPTEGLPVQNPTNAYPGSSLLNDPVNPVNALVQQILVQFQAMLSQVPDIPPEHQDVLALWIRTLLSKTSSPEEPRLPLRAALQASLAKLDTPPHPSTPGFPATVVPPKLLETIQSHMGSKAEIPESWEAWVRGSLQALADPVASPREAPFHALQSKEGTAFFEIPLPWAQAGNLQLWVESDPPEDNQQDGRDDTKRVLLGLQFSNLGETRLGMAQGSFGLAIRVWAEHPEALEADRERLEEELKELGKHVDLRIYAITYLPDGSIPSLRSLVAGPSLQALG